MKALSPPVSTSRLIASSSSNPRGDSNAAPTLSFVGGFWITDRASRNGVVVTLPDGASRTLAPRTRTPLPAGATVTLGGRSFTVTQDSGR